MVLTSVLLPADSATASSLQSLFTQLHAICRWLRVSLCGGHTEEVEERRSVLQQGEPQAWGVRRHELRSGRGRHIDNVV